MSDQTAVGRAPIPKAAGEDLSPAESSPAFGFSSGWTRGSMEAEA